MPATAKRTTPKRTPSAEDREPPAKSAVVVQVPLSPSLDGSVSRRVRLDCTLKGEHAETLKRLRAQLHGQSERTANGRHVETNIDAVRWLLEQANISPARPNPNNP